MKRLIDIFGSILLITVLCPFLVFIALAIRLSSPGPVFFVQRRIGLKGRVFRMVKFRTMFQNTEKMGTGLYSFNDDPRITKVGRILRHYSLDELPQLFNVLVGSMSLVGPRPPVTYELGPWDDYTPAMRKRFDVKPGITGLAQVSGRNELNWDQKIVLDNLYVDRVAVHGALPDIVILLRTVWLVLQARNTIEKDLPISAQDSLISARARSAGQQLSNRSPGSTD